MPRKRPLALKDTPLEGTPKGVLVFLNQRAVSVDEYQLIHTGIVYPEPINVIGWDNPSWVPHRRLIEDIVMREFKQRSNNNDG